MLVPQRILDHLGAGSWQTKGATKATDKRE
jgi:hypothetical protein